VFEDILQEGESIVFESQGLFVQDGSSIPNEGNLAVTNKRLIMAKKNGWLSGSTIGAIVAFAGVLPVISGNVSIIEAALIGGAAGLFGSLLGSVAENVIRKVRKTTKRLSEEDITATIFLEDILGLEDGKQGLQKMLLISMKNGEVYKIGGLRNLGEWRNALQKSVPQ